MVSHLKYPLPQYIKASPIGDIIHQQYSLGVLVEFIAYLQMARGSAVNAMHNLMYMYVIIESLLLLLLPSILHVLHVT